MPPSKRDLTEPTTYKCIDAGVDWITSTCDDPQRARKLATRADYWLAQEVSRGNDRKPWTFSGYRGYCAGHVQTGERHDGLIVRLGGNMAQRHWLDVWTLAQRVSRLDTQYTVQFNVDPSQIITKLHTQAKRWSKKGKAPRQFSAYLNSDGSSTLYLGSRQSEVFVRMYDKQRESRALCFQGCVRFETEWKKDRAKVVAAHLANTPDVATECASLTGRVVQESGCFPYLQSEALHTICVPQRLTDSQRRLEWLRTQVAPVVKALCNAGHTQDVLQCLSLLASPGAAGEGQPLPPTSMGQLEVSHEC